MKLFLSSLRYQAFVLIPTVLFVIAASLNWISLQNVWQVNGGIAIQALAWWVLISLATHFLVSMLGMLRFGSPQAQNVTNLGRLVREGWDPTKRLVLCFVSQGIQESVLKSSVARAIAVCRQLGARFEVEIVVDTKVPQDPFFAEQGCSLVVVPPWYETKNRSRFKARALSYATHRRAERLGELDGTWVLHCDEDTILTEATIAGVHAHLNRPDSHMVCGAGEIKYNAAESRLVDIFSFLDCHRTGEDLGRFRMQFSGCGAALFGAHGSFVLIPAELERQVDFDFGPRGSITEDIYFALRLRELGISFRWIEGYVREQSPRDPNNFLRQRARWIHGLLNGCLDRGFSWKRRAVLLMYLAMWRTTMISALVLTCVVLASGWSEHATALWSFSMLVVGTNSWVGALRNVEEEAPANLMVAGARLALSVILIPVVCLFESVAVALGVLSRPRDFFVVQKVMPENLAQSSVA